MFMRLIDADKLKEVFNESSIIGDILRLIIEEQPIAYDQQKVINAIDNTVPGITNIQIMKIYDIIKSGGAVDD